MPFIPMAVKNAKRNEKPSEMVDDGGQISLL